VKVRWTTPALREFAAAGERFATRDPRAAEAMLDAIAEQVESLAEYPYRGRPGRVDSTRDLVVAGTPFVVVYQVRIDVIAIVAFLHGRRDWPGRS
jgi:addiction module RelE/StbE family toxin